MQVFSDGFIMSLRQEHSLSSGKHKERSSSMRKSKKNPCLRRCQKRTTLRHPVLPLAMMLLHSRSGCVKLSHRANVSVIYTKISSKIWGGVPRNIFKFEDYYLDDKKLQSILLTLKLTFFYKGKIQI